MCMRRKHNLRLARAIQCISGVLAVLVIYPLIRLVYPCWRRLKGRLKGTVKHGKTGSTGNHGETGSLGDDRATGGPHSSGPSEPHGEPSGKPIAQDK